MKWVLFGFSGVGKTSILKELAKKNSLKLDFYLDSDEFLPSPTAVGWEKFRQEEELFIRKCLESKQSGVLSFGGGAFKLEYLQAYPKVAFWWLDAPFDLLWKRIEHSERPLVADGFESMKKLYEERRKLWEKAPVQGKLLSLKTPSELAEDLVVRWSSR